MIRLLVVFLCFGFWSGQALAEKIENPVTVSLIRDTETIEPDSVVQVGVHFSIKPGWHVYYQNPGETGLGTQVQLFAEDQTSIGDIIWPTPVRFTGAGGVYGYGYSKELLLKIPVQIALAARPGKELRFRARVKWLACSDTICLPGKAELRHPAMIGRFRKGVGIETFAAWEGRYSENLNDIKSIKSIKTQTQKSGDRITLKLVVHWAEAVKDPLWIPDGIDGVLFAEQELVSEERKDTMTIQCRPSPGSGFSEGTIKGILTFRNSDNRLRSTVVWFKLQ